MIKYLLALSLAITNSYACNKSINVFEDWPTATLTLISESGTKNSIEAYVALGQSSHNQGFQYVCREDVLNTAIIFVFERPFSGYFHMNNVNASLDIFLINYFGEVTENSRLPINTSFKKSIFKVRDVTTYYALEAHAGRIKKLLDGDQPKNIYIIKNH